MGRTEQYERYEGGSAEAELLVLGSRGKGGFERFVLGSTAHAVLSQPPCPTVITRVHKQQHAD